MPQISNRNNSQVSFTTTNNFDELFKSTHERIIFANIEIYSNRLASASET